MMTIHVFEMFREKWNRNNRTLQQEDHLLEEVFGETRKLDLRDTRFTIRHQQDVFEQDNENDTDNQVALLEVLEPSVRIRFRDDIAIFFDCMRILLSLFTLVYAPFAISFRFYYQGFFVSVAAVAFEVGMDLMFLLLILISFDTSIADRHVGIEFCKRQSVQQIILGTSDFYVQILSCVPWISIYLYTQSAKQNPADYGDGQIFLDLFISTLKFGRLGQYNFRTPSSLMLVDYNTYYNLARLFLAVLSFAYIIQLP